MGTFIIWEPRWRDKTVLLADRKIGKHNDVHITYKNKEGLRQFPNPFYISGLQARKYPVEEMKTKKGDYLRVRAIPLSKLEEEIIDL